MSFDSMGAWRRTHYSTEVESQLDGQEVILFGWVQEIRDLGGIRFLILQDRTGTIQITIPQKRVSPEVLSKSDSLQKRYSIGVKGIVKATDMTPRGVEVIPDNIKIFTGASLQLPLDVTGKTPAHIDVRLDARPLDLCYEDNIAVFKIQHTAEVAIRDFLFQRGFLEVHTPRIISSATEGGAALFPVDYFGKKAYLAQSPQLYKEELTMSLEKVFEVGHFFRAEESDTRRHLSEFMSVDIEQAFATYKDVMHLLELLIQHICMTVKETCQQELKTLNHDLQVPDVPFKRLKYDEVLQELNSKGITISWGEDIPTSAFRTLGEMYPYCYFITHWPTDSKSFYIQPEIDNPEICESFDLMWSWIELASGGTRIASKEQLVQRLKKKGLNPDSFKYHLKAFDYGMPPHAGWGVGLERLIMMLTGKQNIREVTLYPRDQFRLTP
ncbi:MAG: aspartate--tRNA(Asn) ligase [Thermoproteota archaeon]